MGYHQAGFEVVGVDIAPQPNYPFRFIQADALVALNLPFGFSAIHASPPCQRHSKMTKRWGTSDEHADLVGPTRELLRALHVPYVIENVVGAPLHDPVQLCGSSFGLDVRRHRLFETDWPLPAKLCDHGWQTPRFRIPDKRVASKLSCVVPVYGNPNYAGDVDLWRRAMGIDWMTAKELAQAIPPAYTKYIGQHLMAAVTTELREAA